jgi:hypothetical protein
MESQSGVIAAGGTGWTVQLVPLILYPSTNSQTGSSWQQLITRAQITDDSMMHTRENMGDASQTDGPPH